MLFGPGDFLVDAVAFFLGIFVGEGFAIAGYGAVDADAVYGDAFGVDGFGLLEIAVAVQLLLLGVDVVGVVLVGGFGGALVALYVEEELGDGREVLRGRRGFVGGRRGLDDRRRGGVLREGCCAGEKQEESEAAASHAAL